ncbi:MAG: PepSY domain-containing protein [Bacteroidales bacterium]
MKTLSILSALAVVAIAAPAVAGEQLPATYLIHKLTVDGVQLRSLEPESRIYEARVEATDGSIVKVGVDPESVYLTDAYSHASARKPDGAAPKLNAAEAIQAAAYTGYWDVREVKFRDGRWQVDARNDQGRSRTVTVDATSGMVD